MLAQEIIEPKEEENTRAIAQHLKRELAKVYKEGTTLRKFHPKMHGYVSAEFTVAADLPDHLKVGLFKAAKTFAANVRFSNGNPGIKKDLKKGVRGFAIQLIDDQNTAVQDFVLTTGKVLAPGKVKAYKAAHAAQTGSFLRIALYVLNPFNWRDLLLLLKNNERCPNALGVDYYSATPYLFGEGNAVKYHVRPTSSNLCKMPTSPSEDYLRELLVEDLAKREATFDFYVQFQEHPIHQPIEDSRVLWETPFQKLGSIRIPAQVFDTPDRQKAGERTKYSPWNCLPDHRPLGGINRVRNSVYKELAAFRSERNAALKS